MGDEQHGAFVVSQGFDQHFLGEKIQVVCGFVEDQKVWRIVEHAGHDKAGFFAAGQDAAFLFDVVAGKSKSACKISE